MWLLNMCISISVILFYHFIPSSFHISFCICFLVRRFYFMYIKTGNPVCFYLPVFSLKLMFMMPAAVDFLVSSWWPSLGLYLQLCIIPAPYFCKTGRKSNVYWTVHHCNSWQMKNQLDITCYFISLIMRSTCFGH